MGQLKIVTYNLHHVRKQDRLIRNILDMANDGAQIFCLQEVRAISGKNHFGERLLESLGDTWQAQFLLGENTNDYGLGVVWNSSQLQMQAYQIIELPQLSQLTRLEYFIERYLLSGETTPAKRAAQVIEFSFNDQSVRVINVHFDWHGGQTQRHAQIEHLVKSLQQLASQSSLKGEIIGGDFNTIGFLRNQNQITPVQELLGESYQNLFPTFQLTTMHGQKLDYIFVKDLEVVQTAIHKKMGSDHFPVSATVKL